MAAGGSNKAVVAALAANSGIAVAKFVAFAFTGSAAMMAEGIHSVADSGNQALLLLGASRAKKDATELHQFGYGRERYFWSFVVAIILFALGSLFAIYEGIEKLLHPHAIDDPWWAVGVLIIGIGLEGSSFRIAIGEANKVRGSASWPAFIKRSRVPELPVVILEDFGALIGLVLALGAVMASWATGNGVFDAIGTLCIGTLLGAIAIVLAIEMKSLLIGEAAAAEAEERIRQAIVGHDKVVDLIHMRTQHIGPEEVLVAAKVEFDHELRLRELADVVNEVEAAIRAAEPLVDDLFIEPDVRRPQTA